MRSTKPSVWSSKRFCLTFFIIKGIIIIFIIFIAFAFSMTFFDVSPSIIKIMSTLAICIGSFITSYGYAKKRRRYGLIAGFLCGTTLCIIYILVGLFFFRQASCLNLISKVIIIEISACIGGVIGVNKPLRKPPN